MIKIFGLFPFRIDFSKNEQPAEHHKVEFIYSIFFAVVFHGIIIYSHNKELISSPIYNTAQETLIATINFERLCACFQSVLTYASVYYYRHKLINCINMVNRIQHLQNVGFLPDRIDAENNRVVKYIILWTIVQLMLTICSWILYAIYSDMGILQVSVILFGANCYTIALTFMHYVILREVVQLYRGLNAQVAICVVRIRRISNAFNKCQMKMQMFCDVSDEIDQVTSLYKCITECNNMACRLLSVSILANIVNSFANALIGVTIKFRF